MGTISKYNFVVNGEDYGTSSPQLDTDAHGGSLAFHMTRPSDWTGEVQVVHANRVYLSSCSVFASPALNLLGNVCMYMNKDLSISIDADMHINMTVRDIRMLF